jgi:hypothetical protein
MNWDAIQAIAELAAAVGVLFSLGYLAIQVRQNTASVQAGTVARSSETLNRIRSEIWTDAETARIYQLALSGEELEDPLTATRVRLFLVALARDYEAIYYQNVAGQLPAAMWDAWLKEMKLIFSTPGGADALAAMEDHLLNSEFVQFLKQELATADEPFMSAFRAKWDEVGRSRRGADQHRP